MGKSSVFPSKCYKTEEKKCASLKSWEKISWNYRHKKNSNAISKRLLPHCDPFSTSRNSHANEKFLNFPACLTREEVKQVIRSLQYEKAEMESKMAQCGCNIPDGRGTNGIDEMETAETVANFNPD